MKRRIIEIDRDKCNGCGACASACHEGAIGMVGGKAELLRDDYCDGLGDCLPACPTGAITFVEREAAAYDEAAVAAARQAHAHGETAGGAEPNATAGAGKDGASGMSQGCPGSRAHALSHAENTAQPQTQAAEQPSCLQQWPVQIKLAPTRAPYFDEAKLLVAADCTAFAHGAFHERFIKNHITLVGCPKLDGTDYSEKLAEIIRENDIRSVTIARMEVPCCAGLEHMVKAALQAGGKSVPCDVAIISVDGEVLG